MLRTLIFIAAVAGLAAGIFAFAAQEIAQVPLILEAETYENAGSGEAASGDHSLASHEDGEEAWAPADGLERKFFTLVANILTGMAFALVLVGAYSLWNQESDWRTGLFWGLAGYVTFILAPALGLDPEIPGASAAELADRQTWWIGTVAATGIGLAMICLKRQLLIAIAGTVLIALPHILGAPHPETHGGLAPQALADQYVVATLVTGFFFWVFLGTLSGHLYQRYAKT